MKKRHIYKKIPSNILDILPNLLLSLAIVVVAGGLLWFQLGSLHPGLSSGELTYQSRIVSQDVSVRNIVLENPMFLPFSIGLYLLQMFSLDSITALRSIGAFFGLLSVIAIFFIVRRWHTLRVSLLMTALYASSASLLHSARLADERAVYLLLPVVFALALYVRSVKKTWLQLLLYGFGFGLLLYIPGAIWLIALLVLWQRKRLFTYVKKLEAVPLSIFSLFGITLIVLLAFAFAINTTQLLLWFGLPGTLPSIGDYASNVLTTVTHLFIRGPANPVMWVGIAPILDALVTILFMLGCYVSFFQRKLERTKVLFATIAVLLLLSGFNGPVTAFAIVPFIFLVSSNGLALLLQQWFTVFPRNPFARAVGVGLVIAVVAFSIIYNTQRYYVAWPKTPQVHETFQQRSD